MRGQNMDSLHNETRPDTSTINWMSGPGAKISEVMATKVDGNYATNGDDFDQMIEVQAKQYEIIKIVVPTVFIILLLLGLIANALVVYVTITTNRTAKHPIHSIFVLNLAVSDVIFLIVSGPYWIVILLMPGWRFGSFLCTTIPFISSATVCASIYTICALAWIRFMALTMPFRFQRSCVSTRKAGYFIVLAIWMAGILLSMPFLFNYGIKHNKQVVSCEWLSSPSSHNTYAIATLFVNYMFPLVLVTFFYAVVGREVLCYMMHRNTVMNQQPSDEKKECVKSTIVVLTLILAFLICWLPHLLETIFSMQGYLEGHENVIKRLVVEVVGKATSYTHAIVNPIIYTFASPIFRRNLRSSLSEKLRKCRDPTRCAKKNSGSIVRKNGNVKNLRCSLGPVNPDPGQAVPMISKGGVGVTTDKNEQTHMLVADSHVTEVTRLASPDLSQERRLTPSSLVVEYSDRCDTVSNGITSNSRGSELQTTELRL